MHPRDSLTPEQEAELEALDRALAGKPVRYELRELEELVLDVRATAPAMTPAFAARLEHELSEGFPAPREQPAALRRPGRRRLLLPALGSLAAVLVALVVVLGGGGSDEPTLVGREDSAQVEPSQPAPPAPAAPSPSAARATPVPSAVAPTQSKRKVERTASMAIETRADDFAKATAAVHATVARFGGIVASAQTGESDSSGGEAAYDLRIPTARLDRALAALAKLGHVTERSQGLQDVTGSFDSVQDRLRDVRAERRGLLRALEQATTQAQIDSLKARLRSVGGQISSLKGQLASLRRRADLARVDLTVRGTGDGAGAGAGGDWTPGDAAGDAVRVLEVLAGVLLIALAVLLPAGLLAAAIVVGVRFSRRRRREGALDSA